MDLANWTEENYGAGFAITAIIVFIGSWIYCIAAYGFLLGVGLGWLPSIIVAFVAAILWPFLIWLLGVIAFLWLVGYF